MKNKVVAQRLRLSYGLSEHVIDGEALIHAEHADPQAIIARPDRDEPLQLGRGIYIVEFKGISVSGRINSPCLYLDRGDGYSESENSKIVFDYSGENTWRTAFRVDKKVLSIRLDPSVEPFVGREVELSVTQVSKLHTAAFNMGRWIYGRVVPENIRKRAVASGLARQIVDTLLTDEASKAAALSGSVSEGLFQKNQAASAAVTALQADYWARMFAATGGKESSYAAISSLPATRNEPAFKPIAYYLPQMHPFPENDAWWGKGFTEWTNVSKATAQFEGHYQPKLPGELGFYDLRLPDVMARQIELAKLYGLHGFCFYYYWFGGKRLLEKPLDMFLKKSKDEAFDFPFCLCWANENWTRRWDGAEHEVLMAQSHSESDHAAVFNDLAVYFKDKRYIRIEGKPVILIYRPSIIPDIVSMLRLWRNLAKKKGFEGLYIITTNAFGFNDPLSFEFDALCEFPPHGLTVPLIDDRLNKINSGYSGHVFDYSDVVNSQAKKLKDKVASSGSSSCGFFPGVMTAWDNEARKPGKGNVFHASTPALYRDWLSAAANATIASNPHDRRFVFINAWNEWAEGAYLEPDRRFGYAYLAATADVVREYASKRPDLLALAARQSSAKRKAKAAVCLHIFYPEMIDEFAAVMASARKSMPLDLIVTIPDSWCIEDAERVLKVLKPVRLLPVANRGRDVLPFLRALKECLSMGYDIGCKVHSKKSPQLVSGDAWRRRLTVGLLSPSALEAVKRDFLSDELAGIAAPASEFMTSANHFVVRDNLEASVRILARAGVADAQIDEFVAGTMFWFRFKALEVLAALNYGEDDFGPELGQIDGTLAHAFERIFVPLAKAKGHKIVKYMGSMPGNSAEAIEG
jgi:lipopolysaccharide biosynthesis protein